MPEFTRRIRSAFSALVWGDAPPGESKAAGRGVARGSSRGSLATVPTAGYNAYGGWGGGYGDYSAASFLSGAPGDVDPIASIPLHQNVVVTAGINWLARNLPVPDLTVVHDDNGGGEEDAEIEDHWFIDLLDRPNETRDFFSFFHQCVLSDITDGNTFILKRKDGAGEVVDLWWLPPWSVWPVPDATRKAALSRYEYRSGNDVTVYRPDEILHVVNVPPTDGSLRGSTPLVAATRSVRVINRIELYDDSLLMNFGAASHMISPRDPAAQIQKDDLDSIRAWWAARQTGRNAGKPLVAPRGLQAERIGFSPDEMAIERMPHRHVAHILSVLGLSPMVLGLPDESKTYANLSEANRSAYENALMPMLARFCEGFNHDEDLIAAGERLKPDYSHVPCLQDDRATKIHSLVEAKGAGILDEDECRAEIHYPPRTDAQKEASKPPPVVVLPPQAGLGAGQEPGDETGEPSANGAEANGDGSVPAANGKAFKHNPHHDHSGRFAAGGGHGGGGGPAGAPGSPPAEPLPPAPPPLDPELASAMAEAEAGGRKTFEPWHDSLSKGQQSAVDAHLDARTAVIDRRPEVTFPLTGERAVVEVRANPRHGLLPEEPRLYVHDFQDGKGMDIQSANSPGRAAKIADGMQRRSEREAASQQRTIDKATRIREKDPGRAADEAAFLRHLGGRASAENRPHEARRHLAEAEHYQPSSGAGKGESARSGLGPIDDSPDADLRRRAARVLARIEEKLGGGPDPAEAAIDPDDRAGPDGRRAGPGDAGPLPQGPAPGGPGPDGPEAGGAGAGGSAITNWAADRGAIARVLPAAGAGDTREGPEGRDGADPGGSERHGLDGPDDVGDDATDHAVLGGVGATHDGESGARPDDVGGHEPAHPG